MIAHHNLGVLLLEARRLEEAEVLWREDVSIGKKLADGFPDRRDYRYQLALNIDQLAHLLHNNGKRPEAVKTWREALTHYEKLKAGQIAYARFNLGMTLASMDQLEEAIVEFGEVIKLNKDYGAAQYRLGRALQLSGRFEEAVAEYRDALRINKAKKDNADAEKGLKEAEQPGRARQAAAGHPRWQGQAEGCRRVARSRPGLPDEEARAVRIGRPVLQRSVRQGCRPGRECGDIRPLQRGVRRRHLPAPARGRMRTRSMRKNAPRCARKRMEWLRADLQAWRSRIDKDPDDARMAADILKQWEEDGDFASVPQAPMHWPNSPRPSVSHGRNSGTTLPTWSNEPRLERRGRRKTRSSHRECSRQATPPSAQTRT